MLHERICTNALREWALGSLAVLQATSYESRVPFSDWVWQTLDCWRDGETRQSDRLLHDLSVQKAALRNARAVSSIVAEVCDVCVQS